MERIIAENIGPIGIAVLGILYLFFKLAELLTNRKNSISSWQTEEAKELLEKMRDVWYSRNSGEETTKELVIAIRANTKVFDELSIHLKLVNKRLDKMGEI